MAKHTNTNTTVIKVPHAARKTAGRSVGPAEDSQDEQASQRRKRLQQDPLFQQLIENIYDGLVVTSMDGRIIQANSRAEEIFGTVAGGLNGQGIIELIMGADLALISGIIDALESDKFLVIEGFCAGADREFPAEITVNSLLIDGVFFFCFFVRDISKRMELEMDLLRRSKALASANNAINIMDADGMIVYQNPAFFHLFGFEAEELNILGGLGAIFDENDLRAEIVQAITEEGGEWEGELEIAAADGTLVPVAVRAAAIEDEEENITGLICVYTDITARIQAEHQLRAAHDDLERRVEERTAELQTTNIELEKRTLTLEKATKDLEEKAEQLAQANRYKTEFLANVSHELRTPLNSILLLSKMLSTNKDQNLSDDQIRAAEVIHKSGSDLLSLISEILDLSKVEAGRMEIRPEEIPLADVLDELTDTFAPQAEKKGLDLLIRLDSTIPSALVTDPQRLHQILKNLIANAIKFTDDGSVAVSVQSAPVGSGYDLAFNIIDTGMGIAKDQHEMIFSAFHQVDGSISRRHGGTGLGLSISTELAMLLGGQITLESDVGQGAKFSLLLPRDFRGIRPETGGSTVHMLPLKQKRNNREVPRLSKDFGQADPRLKGCVVLVVDDDMRNVFAVASFLRERGMVVHAAENGEKSIALVQSHPDICMVLMDVMMPVMDGLEATKRIRAGGQTDLPIIALTAKAMKGDREACLEAGMTDYLAKPLDVDALEEMLHRYISFAESQTSGPLAVTAAE